MNKIKKLLASMLAFVMMFALTSVSVAADDDETPTLSGTSSLRIDHTKETDAGGNTINRTYNLYQVFYGNYVTSTNASGETVHRLGDIQWGVSIKNESDLLTALKAATLPTTTTTAAGGTTTNTETALTNPLATPMKDVTTAAEVAEVLQQYTDAKYVEAFATIVANHILSYSDETTLTLDSEYKQVSKGSELSSARGLSYLFDGIHDGYYLVFEPSSDETGTTTLSKTNLILRVIGNIEVTAKDTDDEPGLDKNTTTSEGTEITDGKQNDYAVGDTVYYSITSKMMDMSQYKSYTYKFKDTLSQGLTFDATDGIIEVKVGDQVLSAQAESDTTTTKKYKLTKEDVMEGETDTGNDLVTIEILDPKQYQTAYETAKASNTDLTVSVRYKATINENAEVGKNPNTNKASLVYSNNPADPETTCELEDNTDEEDVYTTGIEIQKVQGTTLASNAGLAGAKFTLTYAPEEGSSDTMSQVIQKKAVWTMTNHKEASTLSSDDDKAKYYFKTSSGDGYVTVKDHGSKTSGIESTIPVRYTKLGDDSNPTYTKALNGEYIKAIKTIEGTDVKQNSYYEENAVSAAQKTSENYEFWQPTYEKTLSETTATLLSSDSSSGNPVVSNNAVEVEVGSNGVLKLDGLKAGTYYLEESVAPAGFKKIDGKIKITVTLSQINATTGEATWNYTVEKENSTDSDIVIVTNENDATGNVIKVNETDGRCAIKVLNKGSGSLPTTGGIGTTIFYIAGGILVIGAGVLLIVKKRMNA